MGWDLVRVYSERHRGSSGKRVLHLSLTCLLFVVLGVLLLACGEPLPALERIPATQTFTLPETRSPSPTAPEVAHSPILPNTPLPPPPDGHELSPIPSPTLTGQEESPIPTPTAPLQPTLTIGTGAGATPTYTYHIVAVFPHDRAASTQGLVFEDGVFFEGTGLLGQSSLRRVDAMTGEVLQLHMLPPELFGEGITFWGDQIIQLTWKAGVGFVYDKESFELLDVFGYPTEGWGITHDGRRLIMSDGTSTLHFWDPETLEEVGQVQVYDHLDAVVRLNELEYVEGLVYANVWWTDLIAMIDPETGQVTGWIDLEGLLDPEDLGEAVGELNGIAYSEKDRRLFVTGKRWPRLFEIELVPLEGDG